MSLYQDLLGSEYDKLPPVVQQVHRVQDELHAAGTGSVDRGHNPFSRLLAAMMRMPEAGTWVPVHVIFRHARDAEMLISDYAGRVRVSRHDAGSGADAGMLLEGFGPVRLVMALGVEGDALASTLCSVRLFGVPLPRFLWPRIQVYESEVDGWYVSYVDIALPLVGRLIRYCCRIKPEIA